MGRIGLEVVDAGDGLRRRAKRRMGGDIVDPLAADIDHAAVAQRFQMLLARAQHGTTSSSDVVRATSDRDRPAAGRSSRASPACCCMNFAWKLATARYSSRPTPSNSRSLTAAMNSKACRSFLRPVGRQLHQHATPVVRVRGLAHEAGRDELADDGGDVRPGDLKIIGERTDRHAGSALQVQHRHQHVGIACRSPRCARRCFRGSHRAAPVRSACGG